MKAFIDVYKEYLEQQINEMIDEYTSDMKNKALKQICYDKGAIEALQKVKDELTSDGRDEWMRRIAVANKVRDKMLGL